MFVSKKRSEGFYAEILHEHASVLWGPMAVMGVAAWVSEEAAEEGDEVMQVELKGPQLPHELSLTAGMMIIGTPLLILAVSLLSVFRHAQLNPKMVAAGLCVLVIGLGLCVLVFGLFALYASYLSRWIHAFWSGAHRLHEHASVLHAVIALVLLLIATDLGFWVFWTVLEFLFYRVGY